MLGISDPYIVIAYLSSIGLAALCMAYGIINWNNDGETNGS